MQKLGLGSGDLPGGCHRVAGGAHKKDPGQLRGRGGEARACACAMLSSPAMALSCFVLSRRAPWYRAT